MDINRGSGLGKAMFSTPLLSNMASLASRNNHMFGSCRQKIHDKNQSQRFEKQFGWFEMRPDDSVKNSPNFTRGVETLRSGYIWSTMVEKK